MQLPDISEHYEQFLSYTKPFMADESPMLTLKIQHTEEVVSTAKKIITEAKDVFSPKLARATLIAAQYHDIGRFPQYTKWHTFKDVHSINHGALGCAILRRERLLHNEEPSTQRLVRIAVCLHNRRALPSSLEGEAQLVANAVRDADKVDIFRIMAKALSSKPMPREVVLTVRDEPQKWSEKIASEIRSGQVPSYADLVYVNDFRMTLLSWIRELHFASSRRILAQSPYPEAIFAGLPNCIELRPTLDVLQSIITNALV